jgi:hypothetical protein
MADRVPVPGRRRIISLKSRGNAVPRSRGVVTVPSLRSQNMNFSLRTLLLAILVLAIGVSAFVFQLQWATSLIYTICVTALLLATVAAIFARGERRLFWTGFAVLGWGYWALAFDASPQIAAGGQFRSYPVSLGESVLARYSNAAPARSLSFVSSDLLDLLERYVTPSKRIGARALVLWGNSYWAATIMDADGTNYLVQWDDGSSPSWTPGNQIQPFAEFTRTAGHSLLCLLYAVAGGALVVWLFRERPQDTKPPNASAAGE